MATYNTNNKSRRVTVVPVDKTIGIPAEFIYENAPNPKELVQLPITLSMRLINSYNSNFKIKAVLKLRFAGFMFNDILLVNDGNQLILEFPKHSYQSHGKTKESYVTFPCVPEVSHELNRMATELYAEAIYKHQMELVAQSKTTVNEATKPEDDTETTTE